MVRMRLRDHADGELAPAEMRAVQEHVHGCGDCDRALSRMELEVLRLRRAFHSASGASEPPDGFTASVMARVRALARAEAEQEALAELRDFTPRVVARARAALRNAPWWQRIARAAWHGERRFWLPSAAAVLVAAIAALLYWQPALHEGAELQVVAADGASAVQGPVAAPLRAGMRLPLPAAVRTAESGSASLLLPGGAGVELGAASGGQVSTDQVDLEHGVALIENLRALRLRAGTASWAAELGPGRHVVTRERVQRLDGLGGRELGWRIQLESIRGHARVLLPGAEPLVLAPGFVATFSPGQPFRVEPGAGEIRRKQLGTPSIVQAPVPPLGPAMADAWAGQIVDELTGEGLEHVHVHLRTSRGAQTLTSDEAGRFLLRGLAGAEGHWALLRLTWDGPASVPYPDLGPVPIRLLDAGRIVGHDGPSLAPLAVARERVVAGRVLDQDQRPLAGARITPLFVDELAGSVLRVEALATTSDGSGTFRLRRLPSTLAPFQRLGLLVEPAQGTAAAFAEPSGPAAEPRDQALQLQMPPSRARLLAGLPPLAPCVVLEGFRQVPSAALLRRHELEVDASGRALLRGVGDGPCWIETADGRLRELRGAATGAEWQPGAEVAGVPAQRLRTGVRAGPGGWITSGPSRFARLAPTDAASRFLTVRDVQTPAARGGTWVFAAPTDGTDWWLVGEFDGRQPLAIPAVEDEYDLLAVGADGGIAVLRADAVLRELAAGATMLELPFTAPGRVEPGPELAARATAAGGLAVRVTAVESVLPALDLCRRFEGGGRSSAVALPPGRYRCELQDGSARIVTVAAGQRLLLD